jgi:hypothetical protein
LATRFPLARLFPRIGVDPRDTARTGTPVSQIRVAEIQVVAASNGSTGGFDAVQLRRADPVIPNAADQSPIGLLGGTGTPGDGIIDVPLSVDPNGFICHVVQLPQTPRIPISHAADVWILTYSRPRFSSSFVCAELPRDTYLGQSFFVHAGGQPYTRSDTANFMQRLVFAVNALSDGEGESSDEPAPTPARAVEMRVGDEIPRRILSPKR